MKLRHKEEMKQTIGNLLANNKFACKNVLTFGHCNATEEMIDYLLSMGVTVNAILDNNKSKQGNDYKDIKIVPPQYIKQFNYENTIVLIATRFFEPMAAQLKELGYLGEIVKVVDYNSFAEYSVSDDTIKRKTERMIRGTETLKAIREQFPHHHLVICPNNALGDVYVACSYLPAYCDKKEIENIAIVVVDDGCRQIAEMFDIANVVTLDDTKMDEFVQAIIFNHEDNCIIAHHDRPYTDNIIKYIDKYFLSFTDCYKYAVFGLGKEIVPVKPSKIEQFDNKPNLIEGKSVIIAPYAKSVVQPSRSFWDKIVKDYQQIGFQVYTYVFGSEEPLVNTIPITIPLNQLIGAVEFAGHFVGLRSGLCDIVSTANCQKTVIMPDCFYSTTSIKIADFFALPGWEQIIV